MEAAAIDHDHEEERLRLKLAASEATLATERDLLTANENPTWEDVRRFLRAQVRVRKHRAKLRAITGEPVTCERCGDELDIRSRARSTPTGYEHRRPCTGAPIYTLPRIVR